MKTHKNPSNRNSIPRVIISDYDETSIKEIKVKYLKLSRLDRITIEQMDIVDELIEFKKVLINGIEHPIDDKHKIEFSNYEITGFLKPSKRRQDGKESQAKYIITITDKNLRDEEDQHRSKTTEREVPNDQLIKTYKRISGFDNITSKEIYKIKRYIDFKNEMMFYFQFIDEFFKPLEGKNFHKSKIEETDDRLARLIKYRLNDDFKNGVLQDYITKENLVKGDFVKIQHIFTDFRHALAHFNFEYIQRFFDDKLNSERYNTDNIVLVSTLLNKTEEKAYYERNNYIDDEDVITIFDEKDMKLSKLHDFYTRISQKRLGFNKLINSFLSKDGEPNIELKNLLSEKGYDYFEDIHAYREYKNIYIEHKKLVAIKQNEELKDTPDGKKLKDYNDKLQTLKNQMDKITKQNSLKRLEVKLRLAFGFIANEYDYNFKKFNGKFTEDVKKEEIRKRFKETPNDTLMNYFSSTFQEKKFFHFQVKSKKKTIFNQIERDTLQSLVKDSPLLQIITLLYLFLPREIQGEFVNFILRIYHQTKNISSDTKQDEAAIEDIQSSFALKLKVLAKSLRGMRLFSYSISHATEYNKNDKVFYERGNRWKNIYKKLRISHNQEEFDIYIVSPILKYHINLYKLIGDFEIYALLKYGEMKNNNNTLSKLAESDDLKGNSYYNFSTLLSKVFIDRNEAHSIECIRNNIAHQDIKEMIKAFEEKTILKERQEIVEYLKKEHPDMNSVLFYDALNDFTMKTVQFLIDLKKYKFSTADGEKIANKTDLTIKKLEIKTPDDYYLVYKLKAIELLKQEVIASIGQTEQEKQISNAIANVGS